MLDSVRPVRVLTGEGAPVVRCYDCGQPVPDDQLVRMDVRPGPRFWISFGRGRGPRSYWRRVNLCPACARKRRERAATGTTVLLLLLAVPVLFLVVTC